MATADTIVAVSSAPGRSLRFLFRFSGPEAFAAAHQLGAFPASGTCGPVRLQLNGWPSLPALASHFQNPASFTGEDTVEVLVVGNPTIREALLQQAAGLPGVRLALPGEFSARAFLNGRLTLDEAEGIAALIGATNSSHLTAANRLLNGEAGDEFKAWAATIANMLALTEAGIDFTDAEDVVGITPASFIQQGSGLAHQIRAALSAQAASEVLLHLPRVAIIGQPNAGKSTLFNALLGKQRSVASPLSGTTRDVISEELDLSSVAPLTGSVVLEDLPGLDDDASGVLNVSAQAAALAAADQAEAAIWCDPTGRFEVSHLVRCGLSQLPPRLIRVQTFADRAVTAPASSPTQAPLQVCGLDGFGLAALKRAIADAVTGSMDADATLVVPRHRRAAHAILAHLDAALALAAAEPDQSRWDEPETAAGELRAALDAAEELAGRMTPDDILGRVFATFCIGK